MIEEGEGGLQDPQPSDWILVHNWERFQHYKDRGPTWIKIYTSLLRNPKYLSLSMGTRGLLHTIWMLFAVENGTIRVQDCSHFAHKRVSNVQLISLNHAGFITFSASKPLALSTEVEKEKEKELALIEERKNGEGAIVRRHDNQPTLLSEAFELINQWPGGTSEEFTQILDDLEKKRRAKLRESERVNLWDFAQQHTSTPDDDIPF